MALNTTLNTLQEDVETLVNEIVLAERLCSDKVRFKQEMYDILFDYIKHRSHYNVIDAKTDTIVQRKISYNELEMFAASILNNIPDNSIPTSKVPKDLPSMIQKLEDNNYKVQVL